MHTLVRNHPTCNRNNASIGHSSSHCDINASPLTYFKSGTYADRSAAGT